ncbi:MAG TPA: ester cyclase [Anaerolineales bacterium]|nr:ester cyclase [Anaerolineales bacterium]
MSTENNKSIVFRLFDEVMKGNLAIADELIAEDYAQHSVFGIPNGREGFKQFFMAFAAAVPDARFVIEDMIAEGDKVVTRLTVNGTQTGALQGIPPTGKKFSMKGIDIFRVENGKIVEHWDAVDQLGMLQQLGVIPMPS